MLNFNQKKPQKAPKFSIDRARMMQNRQTVDHRRFIHFIFIAAVAIICAVVMWSFVERLKEEGEEPYAEKLQKEIKLEPMVRPSIASLPPLPTAQVIAEQKEAAATHLNNRTVPLWIEQPDAGTLAWIIERLKRDEQAPPIPQRVKARDLILRHIKVGSTVIMTGMLEDSQPAPIEGGEQGFQQLLIRVGDDQYLQALAPESARDLVIGESVQVIGRFLGFGNLPPAHPEEPPVPTTTAPTTTDPQQPEAAAPAAPKMVEVPYLAARVANHPAAEAVVENPYTLTGNWQLPPDIYDNIDDDLLVVETRPYYFTLGQVLADQTAPNVYAEAKSANELGSQIHRDPSLYRGQPFTLVGHVFHAWEDEDVQQDKPFGIDRVVRVIMWSEDWGDWDMREGDKIVTKRKLILRTFEAAMITHQPLPKPGDMITVTGRFLRIRAMEVDSDPQHDRAHGIHRHSNRAYTFLFVTGEYDGLGLPQSYDFTPLVIIILIIAGVIGAIFLLSMRKDDLQAERIQESVRKLREGRRALLKKRASAPDQSNAASETTDDQTGESTESSPGDSSDAPTSDKT